MLRAVPLFLVLVSSSSAMIDPEALFKEFEAKFEKVYESVEERLARMAIFAENLVEIERMNAADPGAQYSHLTPFADWTQQEFLAQNKLRPDLLDPENMPPRAPDLPTDAIPDSFDWREKGAVNPVKNQGQCGSCWAFATVGNIEGVNFMKTGKLLSLSEQELVDCDKKTGNEGCLGGLPLNAYKDMVDNNLGLEAESDYSYKADDLKCSATEAKEKVFITNYTQISTNETQMQAALVKYGPLAIGINAGPMQFYFGGIASPWKILCNPKGLDHGVVLVGYGTGMTILHGERDYWVIRNSWGPSWGEKGYYRIIRNTGACGLNQAVTTAMIGDVETEVGVSSGSIVV